VAAPEEPWRRTSPTSRGHQADFAARRGFTYTVLDPADLDVVGCVYIYPSESEEHDVRVTSWVRATRSELDTPLRNGVSRWLATDWPFERVDYELEV
jgi:hypothetical protein